MPPTKTARKPAAKAAKPSAPKAKTAKTAKPPATNVQTARKAAVLLKHVSDPTRLQVVQLLSAGEKHVGALCAELSQSQPAVSHHLALLRHGGVITPRRQGKNSFYSLTEMGEKLSQVVRSLSL